MREIEFNGQKNVEPVEIGDVFILKHPDGIFTVMVCPEDAAGCCDGCVLKYSASCNQPWATGGILLCGPEYVFKSIDTIMENL